MLEFIANNAISNLNSTKSDADKSVEYNSKKGTDVALFNSTLKKVCKTH